MQMSLIRRALCASTAIVCAAAMPGGAHAAQEVRQFAIDAQPAETAVSQIGYQGGVQIIAQRKLLRDVRTNAVRGAFTVSEAMSRLFVDTSLEARQTGPNTYVVVAKPDALRPADVDETPRRGELPRACANRLARAKADAALKSVRLDDELRGSFILAADTVVAVGRRILPKANLVDEASQCLRLLSGRNHRVYTAVCLVTPKETFRQRLVETRVRFKRLSEDDIQAYIGSGEWRAKAGGYAIQGIAGSFVVKMVGSYTNVVGLPLYESIGLLGGEGFPIRFGWLNAA